MSHTASEPRTPYSTVLLAALITAKQAGETVEKAAPPVKATGAVDLMEALRASVEKAKSPKATGDAGYAGV